MRWLLTPIILVLAGSAVPAPTPELARAMGSWCGSGDPVRLPGPPRILEGYGPGGFAITTSNRQAQAFFSNGLQLAHAFAHRSAIDAMEEAVRLDPECAMCAWGHAWALGPTINYPINAEQRKRAAEITATAEKLAANPSDRDRKLIAALKLRYADDKGNRAFADAMSALAKDFPADDAILTIAADAEMIASDYSKDQAAAVALLETVLKRNADYAPAIHFYIHSTEWAGFPERAEPYADRLGKVAPAASHLVHMPSHTYYWIGRYHDAGTSNLAAANIGIDQARALGIAELTDSPLPTYHLHNVHFGIGGALMAGDGKTALAIARPFIASSDLAKPMPNFRQRVLGHAYIALARFAGPEEMLRQGDPGGAYPIAQMLWRYARGEAQARLGDTKAIRAEARAIPKKMPQGGTVAAMATVARHILEGRAFLLERRHDRAVAAFAKAAKAEEAFPLGSSADPPAWWFPARRGLAAALLDAGDDKGAIREATAALKRRPRDPVSHAIRAEALRRLNRAEEAAKDSEEVKRGWHGDPAGLHGPLA